MFAQLCVLPIPRLPRPPVHPGVRLSRRRVQVLPRVWLPRPDSPDPVHQENPALRGNHVLLLNTSSSSFSPRFLSLTSLSSPPSLHLHDSAGPASLNWMPSRSSGVHWCLFFTALFFLKKHHQKKKMKMERFKKDRETGMTEWRVKKAESV